jgi:hypothetical protein
MPGSLIKFIYDTSCAWLERRARNAADKNVDRTRQHWQRTRRMIRFGPVRADYYGDQPDNLRREKPDHGVLGVIENWLVFEGTIYPDIRVPLDHLRWLGESNAFLTQENVFCCTCELESGWRMYTFGVDDAKTVMHTLRNKTRVPLAGHLDFGPVKAMRHSQDIYGHWSYEFTTILYLIPDHLLADWRTAVRLDRVRALAVLPFGPLGNSALLRIESRSEGSDPKVSGYVTEQAIAFGLANALSLRTGITPDYATRKKKID